MKIFLSNEIHRLTVTERSGAEPVAHDCALWAAIRRGGL